MTDHPVHALVRQLDPAPSVEDLLSADTGNLLARAVMATPPPRPRRRRRLVKVSVAGLGLALGAAGTALAVQALQPPKTQIQVFCNFPDPDSPLLKPHDNIGATGDPVTDCADLWRHETGSAAPALKAYQDTYSQIQVFPADHVVPSTWRPLPVGVLQDPEQILLNEALGDAIDGLETRCFSEADATAKAKAIVAASGFSGWPVHLKDKGEHLGPPPYCWGAAAIPRDHTVHGGPAFNLADYNRGRSPYVEQLAKPLRMSLTECWSLPTAVAQTRAAVAQSGLSVEFQKAFQIRQVPTPSARCTSVHFLNLTVTLRGPAG